MVSRALAGALLLLTPSCSSSPGVPDLDFRQEMRTLVQEIATYARGTNGNFLVIPQNGQELLTRTGRSDGPLVADYVAAMRQRDG